MGPAYRSPGRISAPGFFMGAKPDAIMARLACLQGGMAVDSQRARLFRFDSGHSWKPRCLPKRTGCAARLPVSAPET